MALQINEQNFDEIVLKSGKPAMVEFFAEWCGPCKMLAPVIDELAEEYKGKEVVIGKVNVDENNALASKYEVMSIPTIIFFNGEADIAERVVGVQRKEKMKEKIDSLMK